MPKKIAVVVNSRANYGRVKSVMDAIIVHPELELQLIAGASALLPKYSAGIPLGVLHERVYSIVEGGNLLTMAKSTGLALMELATVFNRLRPDMVVVVADRFEQLAVAIAAAYQNIPVAHIQGGEVTGSIDESVRHAITKLSHVHFVATNRAARFVEMMGEREDMIFNVGCPSIDLLDAVPAFDTFPPGGTGTALNALKPWLLVLQHPVTTEQVAVPQMAQTLAAVVASGMQAVWLWPNIDAGSEGMSKLLRDFHEKSPSAPIHFYRNLPPEQYYTLMKGCYCMLGNSSSAIREGSYLGTPAINIGSRQQHRERGPNVVDVGYFSSEILDSIRKFDGVGRFGSSSLYGDGQAGKRIAEALAHVSPQVQKVIDYV